MSELPKELNDKQAIEDMLVESDSGISDTAELGDSILESDTGESVLKYIESEFVSALETEEKEAAIARILSTVPDRLRKLGLEGGSGMDEEMIDELMGYGYEDEEDIENLYFYTWDKFREEFGPFTKVKPEYMLDDAARQDSDDLEKKQNDQAIHELITIGVDADHVLDVRGNPTHRRNIRRLSWILGNEPSIVQLMATLPKPEVASIDLYNLAEYVKSYLCDLKETMDSMDLSKMDHLDRNKHRGQMGMLRCSIVLAESIVNSPHPQ